MRPRTKAVVVVLAVPAVLALIVLWQVAAWRRHYPYGFSHCCDLNLHSALAEYATKHGGAFPAGEATPEASMSLVYREKWDYGERLADERLLRGRTVPESVVKEVLQRGDLLTPETCGWHYVEGLRLDDDPRLALFWDKIGLDHNGGLLREGGHYVLFVDGQRDYIREADWPKFLEDQRKLLAEWKTTIHHDATITLDGGEVHVRVRVMDDSIYGSTYGRGERSRKEIATLTKQNSGSPELPIIPKEEIRDAKVLVEPNVRVRFVLRNGQIVYNRSGFRYEPPVVEPVGR